jgi:hypothetical protein
MTILKSRIFVVSRAACALLPLLAAGCVSYRVDTSLRSKEPAAPLSADVKFSIAAVQFVTPTNVPTSGLADFGTYQPGEQELRGKLADMARKTYPDLFPETPDAIPLNVKITRSSSSSELGGEACASCLTLSILPLRSTEKTEYTVQVQVKDGAVIEKLAAPVTFAREDTSWMSILPTGWIPVPGGKGERAWGMTSALEKGGNLTLMSTVEATVTAIRRVDAESWQKVWPAEVPGEKK